MILVIRIFLLVIFCVNVQIIIAQNRTLPDYRDLDGEVLRGEDYTATKEVTLKDASFLEAQDDFVNRYQSQGLPVPNDVTRFFIDQTGINEEINDGNNISSGIPFPIANIYPEGTEITSFQQLRASAANGIARVDLALDMPDNGRAMLTPSLAIISTGSPVKTEVGMGMALLGKSSISNIVGQSKYGEGTSFGSENKFYALDGGRMIRSDNPAHSERYFLENNQSIFIDRIEDGSEVYFEMWQENGTKHIYRKQWNRFILTGDEDFYLDQTEDINGNLVKYYYKGVGESVVLSKVEYGGNVDASIDHPYEIDFEYEYKEIPQGKSYGRQKDRFYLLKRVVAKAFDRVKTNYDFQYYRSFENSAALYLTRIDKSSPEQGDYPSVEFEWGDISATSEVTYEDNREFINESELFNRSYFEDDVSYNIAQIDYDNDGFKEIYFFPLPGDELRDSEDFEYIIFDYIDDEFVYVGSYDATEILATSKAAFQDPNFVLSDPKLWDEWNKRYDLFVEEYHRAVEEKDAIGQVMVANKIKGFVNYVSTRGVSANDLSGGNGNMSSFDLNKDGRGDFVYKRITGPGTFEIVRSTVNADGTIQVPSADDVLLPEVNLNIKCGSDKFMPNFWQFEYDLDKNGFVDLFFVERNSTCSAEDGDYPRYFKYTVVYDDGSRTEHQTHYGTPNIVAGDGSEEEDPPKFIWEGNNLIAKRYLDLDHFVPELVMFNDLDHDGTPELKFHHHSSRSARNSLSKLPMFWGECSSSGHVSIEDKDDINFEDGYRGAQYVDINDDGSLDIIAILPEGLYCHMNNGRGQFSQGSTEAVQSIQDAYVNILNDISLRTEYNIRSIYPGDFDGNGRADLLFVFGDQYAYNPYDYDEGGLVPEGSNGESGESGTIIYHETVVAPVFNRSDGYYEYIPGQSFTTQGQYARFKYYLHVLDLNGDNRSDFFIQNNSSVEAGTTGGSTKNFRLYNPKRILDGDNFALPYHITRVTNKNKVYDFFYTPAFADNFDQDDNGEYVSRDYVDNYYLNHESFCEGSVISQKYPGILLSKMEVSIPTSNSSIDLYSQVFLKYGQGLVHHQSGFLGYDNIKQYTRVFDSDAEYRFSFTETISSVYTNDCGYSYNINTDVSRGGFVSTLNDNWENALQLTSTVNSFDLGESGEFNYQNGVVSSKTSVITDLETDDVVSSESDFTNGLLTEKREYLNSHLISKVEYQDYFRPTYWFRPILARTEIGTNYCVGEDCDRSSIASTNNTVFDNEGRVTSIVRNSDKAVDKQITSSFEYNTPTKRLSLQQTSSNGDVEQTSYIYDETGLFLESKTNTLGHTVSYQYNKFLGKQSSKTNSNGLTTFYNYDDIGRLISKISPRGHVVNYEKQWALNSATAGANPCFQLTETGDDMPTTTTFVDFKGNPIATQHEDKGTDGIIFTATEYDTQGRKIKEYLPSRISLRLDVLHATKIYTYDYRGRLTKTQSYRNGTQIGETSITSGFQESENDPYGTSTYRTLQTTSSSGQFSKKVTNGLGNTMSVEDNLSMVSYKYGVHNEPTQITPPSEELISIGYDDLGFQSTLTDPDFGTMTYQYNALGELLSQSDGEDTYTLQYDDLGRVVNKLGSSGERTRTFYHNQGQNKGTVASRTTQNGNNELFDYDRWGNLIKHTQLIGGNAYQTTTEYDVRNRPTKVTHPSGVELHYEYNEEKGFLEAIRLDDAVIWEFVANDAFGNTTNAVRNSGQFIDVTEYDNTGVLTGKITYNSVTQTPYSNWQYQFDDETGNLEFRRNRNLLPFASYRTEYFSYDNLDRLSEVRFDNENASPVMVMEYDASGNIVSKSDVHAEAGGYKYGGTDGFGPHAVKSIVDLKAAVLPIVNQNIIYDGHHQPTQINYDKAGTTGNYQFSNGADNQRRQMQSNGGHWMEGGYEVSGKTYLGSEEWLQTGSTQRYIHYVSSPAGLAAIITGEVGNKESQEIYYPVTDYLGSIIMLLDSDGNVVEERSYDAWGRLRNPGFWDDYQVNELAVTNRGYTFHEHLLDAGLINMNGRLYDPLTGRMLSPDNYVQSAGNPQNYNRYSYVLNNPLKYTDPDGEIIVAALLAGYVNVVLQGMSGNIKGYGDMFKSFGVGAIAGAAGAAVGAGANVALAGGSFGAGFAGTAAGVSSTGFFSGALTGASAGFTSGFISGFGNSMIGGQNLGEAFNGGLKSGALAGATGALLGGVFGGIDANKKGLDFWSGKSELDLSTGFGAHGVANTNQTVTGKYVGEYEGVRMYESAKLGQGQYSGGITLPGRGIVVGEGAFSKRLAMDLVHHEYGHILQAREVGLKAFYTIIGKESLISASLNGKMGHSHNQFWTETWANHLSKNYFGSGYYANPIRFPVQDISWINLMRLRIASPIFWP